MASFPVGVEDDDAGEERDAGDAEKEDLRPDFLAGSPWWKVVPRRQAFGGVEDGKC